MKHGEKRNSPVPSFVLETGGEKREKSMLKMSLNDAIHFLKCNKISKILKLRNYQLFN
jgi:hypothetical protein